MTTCLFRRVRHLGVRWFLAAAVFWPNILAANENKNTEIYPPPDSVLWYEVTFVRIPEVPGAQWYRLYLGTTKEIVESAEVGSPHEDNLSPGPVISIQQTLEHDVDYYWRIDAEVAGKFVRSDVWKFRLAGGFRTDQFTNGEPVENPIRFSRNEMDFSDTHLAILTSPNQIYVYDIHRNQKSVGEWTFFHQNAASLALENELLVLGDPSSSRVHIFEHLPATNGWERADVLTVPVDEEKSAVALDDGILAVTATIDGRAVIRIYERSPEFGNWVLRDTIGDESSAEPYLPLHGSRLWLESGRLFVPFQDHTLRVFESSGTDSWSEVSQIHPRPGRLEMDLRSWLSLAVSGNLAYVIDPEFTPEGEERSRAVILVYERDPQTNVWSYVTHLEDPRGFTIEGSLAAYGDWVVCNEIVYRQCAPRVWEPWAHLDLFRSVHGVRLEKGLLGAVRGSAAASNAGIHFYDIEPSGSPLGIVSSPPEEVTPEQSYQYPIQVSPGPLQDVELILHGAPEWLRLERDVDRAVITGQAPADLTESFELLLIAHDEKGFSTRQRWLVRPRLSPQFQGIIGPRGLAAGEPLTLEVDVFRGKEGSTYSWFKDDRELEGFSGPVLQIDHVTMANAGAYEVLVTNPYGNARSAAWNVEVVRASPVGGDWLGAEANFQRTASYPATLDHGYDLSLMSVATPDDLSDTGESLVIVALVGNVLHIRIVDDVGQTVVDKAEAELVNGQDLTDLKMLLNEIPFPDESSFSDERRQEIVNKATSISGHTLDHGLRFDPAWTLPIQFNANTPSSVAAADGRLFMMVQENRETTEIELRALAIRDGTVLWRNTIPSVFNRYDPATPAYSEGRVYAVNGGILYSFDAATGDLQWQVESLNSGHPVIMNGVVYLPSLNFGEASLLNGWNAKTGELLFREPGGRPSIYAGQVYTHFEGRFAAHHPRTGLILWEIPVRGASTPILTEGMAVLINDSPLDPGDSLTVVDINERRILWEERVHWDDQTWAERPVIAEGKSYNLRLRPSHFGTETMLELRDLRTGNIDSIRRFPFLQLHLVTGDALVAWRIFEWFEGGNHFWRRELVFLRKDPLAIINIIPTETFDFGGIVALHQDHMIAVDRENVSAFKMADAPSFLSKPPVAFTPPETYSIEVEAPPMETVIIEAIGLPDWLQLTQVGGRKAELTAKAVPLPGTYLIRLRVRDNKGLAAEQRFEIDISTEDPGSTPRLEIRSVRFSSEEKAVFLSGVSSETNLTVEYVDLGFFEWKESAVPPARLDDGRWEWRDTGPPATEMSPDAIGGRLYRLVGPGEPESP